MTFDPWLKSHRRSILFLLVVMALGGAAAALKLPVSLFPHVDFPRVRINLDSGDRPAERMAIEVTWPIEEAVRAVPGVVDLRSTTSRGSAEISVNFDWNENMVEKMLHIESAITEVSSSLPQGTTFTVKRMDPTVFPVLAYSITSDSHSLIELRDIAMYQLRPLLSTVRGVAKVDVLGGAQEEYRVTVDTAKLASYSLSLTDVAEALSAANVVTAVGRLEDHYKLFLVVSDTKFTSLEEVEKTVLRSGKSGVVFLRDVAVISHDKVPQWIRVTADGHDAVIFQIFQQPGGNTVQIAGEVKTKLAGFLKRLPAGVAIANWYDQSRLILSSAASVREAIIIGVILASLILLLFLRNIKTTIIGIIAVPGVLASTILLLYVLHQSFNIMTLGGMAAAVGLIIDDTVVMLEHIVRRLRAEPTDHGGRIMSAAKEFAKPLTGSSACTIIVFAPLAFLSGVTGAFFKALSLTMASSLVISYFVALLAVPLIAGRLFGKKDADQKEGGAVTDKIHRGYDRVMDAFLGRPWLILIPIILLVIAGLLTYKDVGSGFMPPMDEGGFVLDYRSEPGTSLAETDRLLRQLEEILRNTPEVETYSRRTGVQLGGGVTEANEGDFFVRLKPFPRPAIDEVMDKVRKQVETYVPGLEIEMAQLMEDLIGDLTAVPQPIEIKIYSDDGKLLGQVGPKVAAALSKITGVVDVKNGIVFAGDALDVTVDRVKAAIEGVNPESVTKILSAALSGVVTTQIEKEPKMIGVRLWIPKESRMTAEHVERLQMQAADGHRFPIGRIVSIKTITGQSQITRDNLKRMIAVTGRISGRDMGSVIKDVKSLLSRPGMIPNDAYYSLGGLYEQQQIAFAGLLAVFAAAVALVFLLLLFLYESFLAAGIIMFTTLLSLSAVFIGLMLTGTEKNISSIMGMTMIVGIAAEIAIFYASEYYDTPEDMDRKTALKLAGKNRMRPIAMTTLAAILALMPLALGFGHGSAMQQPLAIAIISGLVLQLPLVLIIMPIFFYLLRVKNDNPISGERKNQSTLR